MKALITSAAIILTTTFASAQGEKSISDTDLLTNSVWKEIRYEATIGKEILVTDCNVASEPQKDKRTGKIYVVVGRYFTKAGSQLGFDNRYHYQPERNIELRVEFDKAADAIWFSDKFNDVALGFNSLSVLLGNGPVTIWGKPSKFNGTHSQERGTKGYVVLEGAYVHSFKKGPGYTGSPEGDEGEGEEGRED